MLDRAKFTFNYISQLTEDGSVDPYILSIFSQHIVIIMYSEIEETVGSIIESWLIKNSTNKVSHFIKQNMSSIISRTSKSDLTKLLKLIDDETKELFLSKCDERMTGFYSGIIAERHNIGHKSGSNVTMSEIQRAIEAAEHVISSFEHSLNHEPNVL